MTTDQQLSAVLQEFASTLVTDFPIQAILDRLVERIVQVLPVTAAGVSLIEPGRDPHFVAASNDGAMQLERLQTALGHGPCLTAYQTGEAVSVPDLRTADRYPEFTDVAADAGTRAVFAFPLRHNDQRLGALDLFSATAGSLTPEDMATAQTLADVVSAYLLNARAREQALVVAERFRDDAMHDGLTGLANRVLLQQRLEHAADRARRSHTNAAVLFADLDGFKAINDTYGHPVGDALLVAVARRLGALLRAGDTLARVSGDEFVILCEDLSDPADVEVLARRIDEAFAAPFRLAGDGDGDGDEVQISASVGMAFAGRAEDIGHGLVRDADTAMYQTKRKGGAAHQVIDLREASARADRLALGRDLRAALTDRGLELAYQPIVRLSDGVTTGMEALLRWTHPVHGPIPPLPMVAIAEQSSLILDIGAWVLQHACEGHRRLQAARPTRVVDLAVNVSPRQLMDPGYCEAVEAVLHSTGLAPDRLILEMTEGIFLDDAARTGSVLADLKRLGVRLALDDFGTGYSSLSYLRQFPVDIIKIDRGFVADIGQHPTGITVVGAISHLAHVLGMTVIAEGVETAQQRDAVAGIGCEAAQGFHFAPALHPADLPAHFDRRAPVELTAS